MSDQEIQIYRANQVVATNQNCLIKIDAGVYDLDFSAIAIDVRLTGLNGHKLAYRVDCPQGFSQALIYVDGKQRFVAQDLEQLQALFYFKKDYQEVFMDSLIDTTPAVDLNNNIQTRQIDSGSNADNTYTISYSFRKFFPGFLEKYLVVRNDMQIQLRCKDVVNSLISIVNTNINPTVYTIGGANATSFNVSALMKNVKGLGELPQQPSSYIDSITFTGQGTDQQTFVVGADEISYMTGFYITDNALLSIDAGFVTPANMTSLTVTRNDFDIIKAENFNQALAQCNTIGGNQKQQNVVGAIINSITSNQAIKYYISFTGAQACSITIMFQRVRQN